MAITVADVRFLIGDDDASDQLMTDTQINNAIAQATGDNVKEAAAWACRHLAARFARQVTTASEGTRADLSRKSEAFREMALEFERQAETESADTAKPYYVKPGSDDADVHEAIWDVGMHDNPNSFDEDEDT